MKNNKSTVNVKTPYLNNLYFFIFLSISKRTSLLGGTISNTRQTFVNGNQNNMNGLCKGTIGGAGAS